MHPDFAHSSVFSGLSSDDEDPLRRQRSSRAAYRRRTSQGVAAVPEASEMDMSGALEVQPSSMMAQNSSFLLAGGASRMGALSTISRMAGMESGVSELPMGESAEMPRLLQQFLGKLDNVEQQLWHDWQHEQETREREATELEAPHRALSSGVVPGLSLPSLQPTPDDIVASSRCGLRTSRAFGSATLHQSFSRHPLSARSVDQPSALGREPPLSARTHSTQFLASRGSSGAAERGRGLSPRHVGRLFPQVGSVASSMSPSRRTASAAGPSLALGLLHPSEVPARGSGVSDASAAAPAARCNETQTDAPAAAVPSDHAVRASLQTATEKLQEMERLVAEKMEPIARHIAGMKRRMLSAQDEAKVLREELEHAQPSTSAGTPGSSDHGQVRAIHTSACHSTGTVWQAVSVGK